MEIKGLAENGSDRGACTLIKYTLHLSLFYALTARFVVVRYLLPVAWLVQESRGFLLRRRRCRRRLLKCSLLHT